MVDGFNDGVVKNESGSIDIDNPLNVIGIDSKDVRYDPDDTLPTYIGINQISYDASTSDNTWIIYKFTYSNNQVTRVQKQINVSWDDRATIW